MSVGSTCVPTNESLVPRANRLWRVESRSLNVDDDGSASLEALDHIVPVPRPSTIGTEDLAGLDDLGEVGGIVCDSRLILAPSGLLLGCYALLRGDLLVQEPRHGGCTGCWPTVIKDAALLYEGELRANL